MTVQQVNIGLNVMKMGNNGHNRLFILKDKNVVHTK